MNNLCYLIFAIIGYFMYNNFNNINLFNIGSLIVINQDFWETHPDLEKRNFNTIEDLRDWAKQNNITITVNDYTTIGLNIINIDAEEDAADWRAAEGWLGRFGTADRFPVGWFWQTLDDRPLNTAGEWAPSPRRRPNMACRSIWLDYHI